ncbi:hypothetical protein BH10ACI3_BH10ACI3_26170 [soil metagenome]
MLLPSNGRHFACDRRRALGLVVFTLSILYFVSDTAAQTSLDDLRTKIASGSYEDKRDALVEIRRLQTADASRIAIPALSDPNVMVRSSAAWAASFLPDQEASKALVPLLSDKEPFVRIESALALGVAQSSSATNALVDRLRQEKNNEARNAVAVALGDIGDMRAVDALTSVLKQKPNGSNEALRRSAARSIGQIAQMQLSGTTIIATPHSFLSEKYKPFKPAKTRENIENSPAFRLAVGVLAKVLNNKRESDDTRRETAFALGAIGDPSSADPLRSQLNSTDYYLVEVCKEALLKIGPAK